MIQMLSDLLDEVSAGLKAERAAQSGLRKLGKDFSPFTYISSNENTISWILADLLDPAAAHGHGCMFLREFLELLGLKHLPAVQCKRVICEVQTDVLATERRHDIVIEADDWIIGIENKPWAADQKNQVHDYMSDLRGRSRSTWHLIYLTRDGRMPSQFSILEGYAAESVANGHLMLLSYGQLMEWLECCERICSTARIANFIADFRNFLMREVLGIVSNKEEEVVVEVVLQSGASLDAALKLMKAKKAVHASLIEKAMASIKERLPANWRICRGLDSASPAIGLVPPGANGWHICFEPQRGEYEDWIYGIKQDELEPPTEIREELRRIGQRLRETMPVSAKSSALFPFYRPFDGRNSMYPDPAEYANWESSNQAWLDMHSDEQVFASNIVGLAKCIAEIATKAT